MLHEAEILDALRDCYDPVLPCNIVDLGYILSVHLAPDPDAPGAGIVGVPQRSTLSLTLAPSTQDETAESLLRAQILNRLAGLEHLSAVTVLLQHDPPWTPLRITPAGRCTLGLDGNRNLVQIR